MFVFYYRAMHWHRAV